MEADLSEELSQASWRQWKLAYDLSPGDHTIQVRATDGDGMTQGAQRKSVAPDGAEGYHTINITTV